MVQRKTTTDNSGCCDPISDLQLEIDQVNETAIDAKTTANTTASRMDGVLSEVSDLKSEVSGWDVRIATNEANISLLQSEINDVNAKVDTNATAVSTLNSKVTTLTGKVTTAEANITNLQDQANTSTAELTNLKPRVSANEDKIVGLTTRVKTTEDAVDTLEGEIGNESTADTIRYRIGQLETQVPTAIKEVTVATDASTIYHNATHISGIVEKDAFPVASRTQAGIMSASMYGAFIDDINNCSDRISVIEQSATTYDITGLVGADPTSAEITAAFQSKYPTVTIIAGMRTADYDNAHFWQYGGGQWIILTQVIINKATNDALGTVKGDESTAGKVFIESDGSMSLNGYDALVSKHKTYDSKISTLETGLVTANANIAANAEDISGNAGEISGLKTRMTTAEGKISANESKISALQTADTTINGKISTLQSSLQSTQSDLDTAESDIDSLEGRMSTAESNITAVTTKANNNTTAINECASGVSNLSTRVTTLENTAKQWVITDRPMSDFISFTYDNTNGVTFSILQKLKVMYMQAQSSGGFVLSSTVEINPFSFTYSKTPSSNMSITFGEAYINATRCYWQMFFDNKGLSVTIMNNQYNQNTTIKPNNAQFTRNSLDGSSLSYKNYFILYIEG